MLTLPVLPDMPDLIKIDVEDITTGTLNGTGTFDKLMQAARTHLQEEYTKGRINSTDYAQVYLGTMTQILEQSMSFVLNKDKSELELQILQMQYQLALLNRDKVLAEIAMIHSNIEMNDQQKLLLIEQTLNTTEERTNIIAQGNLLNEEILLTKEKTDNLKNDNGFKV